MLEREEYSSVFRIGEVSSVSGRIVKIAVDDWKNSSYLLYRGELIKGVSVGSYVKISKGYVSLVGKVEGESIEEYKQQDSSDNSKKFTRILMVSLVGYIEASRYCKGVRELPLLGNEAFLLNNDEFRIIHSFVESEDLAIVPGFLLDNENQEISLSASKLFSSHIGIFGNTGSGKSYTLCKLYNELFAKVHISKADSRFLLFDFNGEYSGKAIMDSNKAVYKLSTSEREVGVCQKLPLSEDTVLDCDFLSIISEATEKTQQPFLRRTLRYWKRIQNASAPLDYFKSIVKSIIVKAFSLSDKIKADTLIAYIETIIRSDVGQDESLDGDYEWHGTVHRFLYKSGQTTEYFNGSNNSETAQKLKIYQAVNRIKFHESDRLTDVINCLYLKLCEDLYENRVLNEHIAPLVNKLKASQKHFNKLFDVKKEERDGSSYIDVLFKDNVFCVIDMNEVNVRMKKMIPLLIVSKLYKDHKSQREDRKYLNVIIDEAHNILSESSERETESWKDYRLETFEEVIKEGRKFGVFLTIASQRPSDISATIISQLHNFFIHRLVNEQDLQMMSRSISYLDKVSHEMLPILPTGACVLAGTISQMPVVMQVSRLRDECAPLSDTIDLKKIWKKRTEEAT